MIMNTGKYGLEIIPYLDTFHAVIALRFSSEQVYLKMSHISQEKKGSNRSKKDSNTGAFLGDMPKVATFFGGYF